MAHDKRTKMPYLQEVAAPTCPSLSYPREGVTVLHTCDPKCPVPPKYKIWKAGACVVLVSFAKGRTASHRKKVTILNGENAQPSHVRQAATLSDVSLGPVVCWAWGGGGRGGKGLSQSRLCAKPSKLKLLKWGRHSLLFS